MGSSQRCQLVILPRMVNTNAILKIKIQCSINKDNKADERCRLVGDNGGSRNGHRDLCACVQQKEKKNKRRIIIIKAHKYGCPIISTGRTSAANRKELSCRPNKRRHKPYTHIYIYIYIYRVFVHIRNYGPSTGGMQPKFSIIPPRVLHPIRFDTLFGHGTQRKGIFFEIKERMMNKRRCEKTRKIYDGWEVSRISGPEGRSSFNQHHTHTHTHTGALSVCIYICVLFAGPCRTISALIPFFFFPSPLFFPVAILSPNFSFYFDTRRSSARILFPLFILFCFFGKEKGVDLSGGEMAEKSPFTRLSLDSSKEIAANQQKGHQTVWDPK